MVWHSRVRRHWLVLNLIVAAIMMLAACNPAPAANPTTPPQAANATPTKGQAVQPTQAAQPTQASQPTQAAAQPTQAAQATPTQAAPAPAFKRGQGGTLKILYWQAPTILNRHLATGTKDADAARLVTEPLAAWGPDAKPIPVLAAEIPTTDNNGVSKDYKTVTWKLKQGVKWSDGSDFTSDDVLFTYKYCADKATACTTFANFDGADSVEAPDKYTVVIHWKAPNANPYQMFVGSEGQILQKKQFQDYVGAKAKDAPGNLKPIGTGPYMVRDFKSADVVLYDANPNYRDPNKPFFKDVQLKGGGDAAGAARAVLQTGDVDYSWNLQVEAALLQSLLQGGKGEMVTAVSNSLERIMVNQTDPNKEVDGEKSSVKAPHPFLSDVNVRRAFAMAIDRKQIADQLYGPAGKATCTYINAPQDLVSPNLTNCAPDLAKANQLLDDAGWKKGSDGIREKNGVKMSVVFQTSVNPLRQKTQELIKASWEKLGVKVELKAIPSNVYFGADVASTDNIQHFYADFEEYANSQGSPDWQPSLQAWTSSEVAQKSNEWRGQNYSRWVNPEYDKLFDQLRNEVDPAKRKDLMIKMNDLIVNDVGLIPLVARTGPTSGKSKELKGVVADPWDSEMWNIADWYK